MDIQNDDEQNYNEYVNPMHILFKNDDDKTYDRHKKQQDINFIKVKGTNLLFVNLDYATNSKTKNDLIGFKQAPSMFQPSVQQTLEVTQEQFDKLIHQSNKEKRQQEKHRHHKSQHRDVEKLEYDSSDDSDKTHKHSKISSQLKKEEKFQWSSEPSIVFTYIVLMLNVKQVKPKQIIKYFPARYPVDTQVISSHLQKYKMKIQKEYDLSSFKEIQPYMYPRSYSTPEIQEISQILKKDPNKVFTDQEINKYLSLFII